MLKSYEAIYENGQFKWLKEQPEVKSPRVIITVLEEPTQSQSARRCCPSESIAGKGAT